MEEKADNDMEGRIVWVGMKICKCRRRGNHQSKDLGVYYTVSTLNRRLRATLQLQKGCAVLHQGQIYTRAYRETETSKALEV